MTRTRRNAPLTVPVVTLSYDKMSVGQLEEDLARALAEKAKYSTGAPEREAIDNVIARLQAALENRRGV